MVETGKSRNGGVTMKKQVFTYHDEMVNLRERMRNIETKLSLINEPMLVDALSYELLGLQARLNFLIFSAKEEEKNVSKELS